MTGQHIHLTDTTPRHMLNVKYDFTTRLRNALLSMSALELYEDPALYSSSYVTNKLQGFLVWNHHAYIAKEYKFDSAVKVDYFIIPVFGAPEEKTICQGTHFIGINIDMHRHIDQTGQRIDMVAKAIRDWYVNWVQSGIFPIELETNEQYVVMTNGMSNVSGVAGVPYNRLTLRFKIPYIARPFY